MTREETIDKVKLIRQITREIMTESDIPSLCCSLKVIDDHIFLCELSLNATTAFCPEDSRKNW